ncbi:MAG: CBS domain-containing protein [Acidobacteriota bacterium]|nr:CBS domain-containing protein [Acidobacteriota bacterium]
MLTTISAVLDRKGRNVWSVPPSGTVHDAVGQMVERRIEALPVLADGKLVGMLTERDCARRVTLSGKSLKEVLVSDAMTSPVIFVTESHTVGDCLQILMAKGFSHLPVVDNDTVVGLISMGDLVTTLVSEKEHTISHLEGYITGRYPG